MNMLEVIQGGAARVRSLEITKHRSCPWCGSDPYPAAKVANRYVVGCEAPDCKVDVQCAGDTPEEAFAIWDMRI